MKYSDMQPKANKLINSDGTIVTMDGVIVDLDSADERYKAMSPMKNEVLNPDGTIMAFTDAFGNVWREAIATPIANIKINESNTGVLSVNYIGYRIIDDDIFAQLSDIESLTNDISTLTTQIQDIAQTVAQLQQQINNMTS